MKQGNHGGGGNCRVRNAPIKIYLKNVSKFKSIVVLTESNLLIQEASEGSPDQGVGVGAWRGTGARIHQASEKEIRLPMSG